MDDDRRAYVRSQHRIGTIVALGVIAFYWLAAIFTPMPYLIPIFVTVAIGLFLIGPARKD